MSSGRSSSSVTSVTVPPFAADDRTTASDATPKLTSEEREKAHEMVWQAPSELAEPPGPEKVLPQLKAPGMRIECLNRRPVETLSKRVEVCRERQRAEGRLLASTFCHGGSLFLVFKHWPSSAPPFPRST